MSLHADPVGLGYEGCFTLCGISVKGIFPQFVDGGAGSLFIPFGSHFHRGIRMKVGIVCMAFAALGACTTASQPLVQTGVAYQPGEGDWAAKGGENAITGNALLRTVGGDVKTCAGYTAQLIPSSPYADARIRAIFPNGTYRSAYDGINLEQPSTDYSSTVKATTCDSQGNFAFRNLADGTYYVTAQVTWGIPNRYYTSTEGGMILKKVTVSGGRTENVVLTQ